MFALFENLEFKNSDLRTNDYPPEQRELISKGGFIYLHILSSILLSKAIFKKESQETIEKLTGILNIEAPARKNEFSKRKASLFNLLNDDDYLSLLYNDAKVIFDKASDKYHRNICGVCFSCR